MRGRGGVGSGARVPQLAGQAHQAGAGAGLGLLVRHPPRLPALPRPAGHAVRGAGPAPQGEEEVPEGEEDEHESGEGNPGGNGRPGLAVAVTSVKCDQASESDSINSV